MVKIIDNNYCRICRQFNVNKYSNRTNYCQKCKNNIALKKNVFNRWVSSKSFISTSFSDCVESSQWNGFSDIKFDAGLIGQLVDKFPGLNYLVSSSERKILKNYQNNNFLYLLSDSNNVLLKVGQTQNLISRFDKYYNISTYKPIYYHIFNTPTYELQDLYEDKVRNYLEFLGYLLPNDNSGLRLKYILSNSNHNYTTNN